jgi:F-type H+-transporting ATPase subunit a
VPTGALAKKILLFTGVGLVALMLVGFVFGAVGSAMFGTDQFLDKPEIHLPPQPIFPADTRDEHLGLLHVDGESGDEEAEAHFSPLGATEIAVTNTLLSSWFTTIVLILIFVTAARRRSIVPGRFQGFVEIMIEGVLGFGTSVLGTEMARKTFPVVATIFFFVLFNAWLSLLPFYQFLGFTQDGEIKAHILRSAGTDINMPLALALISFVFVEYWGFRSGGFGYLKKFFQLGKIFRGKPSGLIDAFVGFLELTSELVRVVSFTFRLFGNMTAGEILVVMITFLVPFVATQFVFGLELLVGLIQAVIFAGLTLVFLSVATTHNEH